MSLSTSYRFFLFFSLLLLGLTAEASHIVGAEITYEPYPTTPVNPRRYLVTAKLYRDNSGNTTVDFTQAIALYARLNGCSPTDPANVTFQLNRVSKTNTGYVRCAGGPGVEAQLYTADITLPSSGNWTLSIAEENRTFGILNLSNSGNYSLYADAELTIDPASVIPNTSPVFTSSLLPYICGNQFHRFSFSAYDANGDSLVYRMITPQGTSNSDFCPQTIPVVPTPHFTIDPARGELSTIPFTLTAGFYIMAARVEEYRRIGGNWRKIGSVMRDIMYPVSGGTGNRNPSFTSASVGTTTQPVTQVLRVVPGQTVTIQLAATDQDAGQVLRFSTEATTVPGVSFRGLSATQAQLTWQVPINLPLGRYSIPVVVQDNGCPFNGSESQTLNFVVTTQVLATPSAWLPNLAAAFPTPFQDQVQFQLPLSRSQQILITDEVGRTITRLTSRADGTVVWQPTGSVKPGTYLARTTDGSYSVRLVHY